MVITACHCNGGIPGVESLPAHDHNSERMAADLMRLNPGNPRVVTTVERMPLRDSVRIWVDWKAVARA